MIKQNKELSMPEVMEYLKQDKENESEVIGFIKKFTKLNSKEAQEMKREIQELELMKVKPEDEVKLIDLLPDNQEDLNKIFVEVGLDENEVQKLLDTIKKFK